MAESPSAQHRARMVREMSRELGFKGRPIRGPNSFTSSCWDPSNEAISSTRRFDTPTKQLDTSTQNLPQLRASAEKYNRYCPPEPDFVINTSALARAFPDFSQGCISSDDATFSSEVGRGVNKSTSGKVSKVGQSKDFTLTLPQNAEDHSNGPSKALIGDHQVMSKPPGRPQPASKKVDGAGAGSLRKDAQLGRALSSQEDDNVPTLPLAKTTDYGSGGSRNGSGENRRTLAEMHARVTDEDDGSMLSNDRPANVTLTVRKTRFGNAKTTQASTASSEIPNKFASTGPFLQEITHGGSAGEQRPASQEKGTMLMNNLPYNPTQESYVFPELPQLSELVSGLYQDGTPVFSRHGQPRSSRFVSGTGSRIGSKQRVGYTTADEIPLPLDEEAILLSLKLLQDRVADLEHGKADGEQVMEGLEHENITLKAEIQAKDRRRRSDSALGSMDGRSEDANATGRGQGKGVVGETSKLLHAAIPSRIDHDLTCWKGIESTINKILRATLDATKRKISVAERTIRNLTQDRESAVSQLGVAYITTEELKQENELLRKERDDVNSQLAQLEEFHEYQAQRWAKKEAALLLKVEQSEHAVKEIKETTRDSLNTRRHDEAGQEARDALLESGESRARSNKGSNQTRVADHVQNELRRERADVVNAAPPSLGPDPVRSTSQFRHNVPSQAKEGLEHRLEGNRRTRKVVVEEVVDSDGNEELTQDVFGKGNSRLHEVVNDEEAGEELTRTSQPFPCSTQDLSYLTFLDVFYPTAFNSSHQLICYDQSCDVAKLRRKIEEERAARKQRDGAKPEKDGREDTVQTSTSVKATSSGTAPALPRKSSTKDLTGRTSIKAGGSTERRAHDNTTEKVPILHAMEKQGQTLTQVQASYVKGSASHQQRQSENSVISKAGTRRRHAADEMTSAFILPDITIHKVPLQEPEQPKLSAAAQQVIVGLAQHKGQNCTICQRVITRGDDHTHNETTKQSVHVPKPIPVSERMPETCQYEDGPTMRPSQPPGIALATVMKGLQDELSHLKMKLAQYQVLYNKHDASLSKRQRKYTYKKIGVLLEAIDTKADQIYALYDVLEGQKADGQEISQEEVEVTLQSIGIDISAIGLRGGHEAVSQDSVPKMSYREAEVSDESDDNLPWEGVESTAEITNSGRDGAKSRRGWAL